MAEWIRRMFSKNRSESDVEFDLFLNDLIDSMTPVKTITKERFRVRVFAGKTGNCDDCGRPLHWLSLDFLKGEEWQSMLALAEPNVQYVFSALNELFEFLDGQHDEKLSPRRLPVVSAFGKRWYFDERLRQLRNVENPHDFIDLK